MTVQTPPVLAWRYTPGVHLLRILEQGCILPQDTPETPVVECPVAWFSLTSRFEPSVPAADCVIEVLEDGGRWVRVAS